MMRVTYIANKTFKYCMFFGFYILHCQPNKQCITVYKVINIIKISGL